MIRPEGFEIPPEATRIHGISQAEALQHGEPLDEVLADFCREMLPADAVVGHNVTIDVMGVAAELYRQGRPP